MFFLKRAQETNLRGDPRGAHKRAPKREVKSLESTQEIIQERDKRELKSTQETIMRKLKSRDRALESEPKTESPKQRVQVQGSKESSKCLQPANI